MSRSQISHPFSARLPWLDLFVPHDYGYEFKIILTNKSLGARKALVFDNGRGSQEGIFAELKSDNALGYVPTRTRVGNRIYVLSVPLAHNLVRELQMIAHPPLRATLEKRPPFWSFERLNTFRRRIIQRAGRLIRPQGAAHPQHVRQSGAPRGSCCITGARRWKVILRKRTQCNTLKKAVL